jgi:hypothetical protein
MRGARLAAGGRRIRTISPAPAKGSSGRCQSETAAERRSHLQVQVRDGNACLDWLPTTFPFAEGPRVRIRLPPAESLSLSRIRFRRSRTPAFRAGVRGWLSERVGRDAQGVSMPRQPAAISLSGEKGLAQIVAGVVGFGLGAVQHMLLALQADAQLAIGKPEAALASVAAGLKAVEKAGGAPLEAELYRLKGSRARHCSAIVDLGHLGESPYRVKSLVEPASARGALCLRETTLSSARSAPAVFALLHRPLGAISGGSRRLGVNRGRK